LFCVGGIEGIFLFCKKYFFVGCGWAAKKPDRQIQCSRVGSRWPP
jgi:hypothetical protein